MNNSIEPQTLYEIIDDDILFIDIRDEYQFQKQHIKNFKNIPYNIFSSQLFSLPHNKPICLICYSGKRTKILADELCYKGYHAYYVNGGFQAFLNLHNNQYY